MTRLVPDDEDLTGRFRLSVTRLARVVRQADGSEMAPTDSAMLATIAWEGEPTLGALAVMEHVAPPTVTKSINKLEASGLIERFADSTDGRVTRVRLSKAGKRGIIAYRARVNAWLEEQLADLPLKERKNLAGVVDFLEYLVNKARDVESGSA